VNKAEEFARRLGCGLVLTSRKISAIRELLAPFEHYELLPFEYEQAARLLERLVQDQELLNILKEGLQREDLKLSLTPMSLELLIEIATVEKEIPASTAEIYDMYTDIVLGRYDRVRGIQSVFEYVVKKSFLAELAWEEFYCKKLLQIPKSDFDKFVNKYIEVYGYDRAQFNQFVAEIERAGLLRIGEIVYFRHRSFLDYFSALRVHKRPEQYDKLNDTIVSIYFDDIWTDVAFYYVGIRREIPLEMAQAILEFKRDDFDSNVRKLLVGRLLQAGWNSPSTLKTWAISSGIKYAEPVRNNLISEIESQAVPVPLILSDVFIMALVDYSFGSKTFLREILTICEQLHKDISSWRECLLLLFANRNRMPPSDITLHVSCALESLSALEKDGLLNARDKYIGLFMLQQIEKQDTEQMKSIQRKLRRTRELYSNDLKKFLPMPKKMRRRSHYMRLKA